MVPLVIKSGDYLDQDGFTAYLIDICKKHKQEKRALAFAFIVYDFDDHNIAKILKDTDYWSSLDKISGRFLSVFYINTQDNYFKQRQKRILEEEKKQRRENAQRGLISYMTPLSIKPTPLENSIDYLKRELDMEETIKTPFVLFFQTNDDTITDYFIVTLSETKLEEAFLELKDHIKNAVEAISKVKPQYANNHQEIFNLLKGGVKGGKFYKYVKTKIISKIGLGTIFSFIKLLAGNK